MKVTRMIPLPKLQPHSPFIVSLFGGAEGRVPLILARRSPLLGRAPGDHTTFSSFSVQAVPWPSRGRCARAALLSLALCLAAASAGHPVALTFSRTRGE